MAPTLSVWHAKEQGQQEPPPLHERPSGPTSCRKSSGVGSVEYKIQHINRIIRSSFRSKKQFTRCRSFPNMYSCPVHSPAKVVDCMIQSGQMCVFCHVHLSVFSVLVCVQWVAQMLHTQKWQIAATSAASIMQWRTPGELANQETSGSEFTLKPVSARIMDSRNMLWQGVILEVTRRCQVKISSSTAVFIQACREGDWLPQSKNTENILK